MKNIFKFHPQVVKDEDIPIAPLEQMFMSLYADAIEELFAQMPSPSPLFARLEKK